MINTDKPTTALTSTPHTRRAPGARGPVAQPTKSITPQFVLYVLRRWWTVATPIGLVLAVLAAGAVYATFEKQYKATARLRMRSQVPFLAYELSEGGRGARDLFVQTQTQLIHDRDVLEQALAHTEAAAKPGVKGEEDNKVVWEAREVPELKRQADPLRWLASNLKAGPVEKSEFYDISLTCASKSDSARLVNAVVDEYLLQNKGDEEGRSQVLIKTLSEELEYRAEDVRQQREDLQEQYKGITGEDPFSPVPTMNPDLDNPIADINSRLITAEVEQTILNARIEVLDKELAEKQSEIENPLGQPTSLMAEPALVEQAIEQDPRVIQARKRLALSKANLESTLLEDEEGNIKETRLTPVLREATNREELALEKLCAEIRDGIEKSLASSQTLQFHRELDEMQSSLHGLQSELKHSEATENLLRESLEIKRAESNTVGGNTLELKFKQEDLAEAESVLALLSERILELSTEQRAPDQVKLQWKAQAPKAPVAEGPWNMMAVASLVFFIPFGLVGAWEFLARRVNNAQQLEESAHLKVIGEIAQLPLRARGGRYMSKASVSRGLTVFKESIDGLRTNLMLSEQLMDMKVLAVTSAAANEGKTSVAAQLAVNIASVSGRPTLLIDGDMRSPDIHSIFDISQEPGLAEVLAGECSLEEAIIVRDEGNHTDVLPAGRLRSNPHRLLGNGSLGSLMKEVRSMYDHIIIDTPPILAANEALVLAKQADQTLMCAMKDSSRIDQVQKAQERLTVSGAHPIGVVLSGVPTAQYLHQYGTYSYSAD